MSKLIWILDQEWEDYEIEKNILNSFFPDCELKITKGDYLKDLNTFGKNADAIICQIYVSLPENLINQLNRCKVISVYGVGYDKVDVNAAKKKGIIVCNVPDYCVEEVSDHVIAMIYNFTKKLNTYDLKNGLWGAKAITDIPKRVAGSTLFLLGFGRMARVVAKKAKCLGMKIVAYDPYINEKDMSLHGVQKIEWEEGFTICDYVSIHIPLSEETKEIVGETEFSLMGKDALLINTSRGGIVNEIDLLKAIDTGEIAACALDVMANEPPQSNGKLLNHKKAFITPHVAYISKESLIDLKRLATENVITVLKGEKPQNSVY